MYCNFPFINIYIHPGNTTLYGCCSLLPLNKIREDIINNNIQGKCKICENRRFSLQYDNLAIYNINCLNNGKDIKLKEINVSISSRCNLKCIICFNWNKKEAKINIADIPYSKCEKLVIQGGEPFLYPEDIIETIERISFDSIQIISNGTTINEKILSLLNTYKDVQITFSIDGIGTINDYIRSGSNFTSLISNINFITNKYKNIKYNISYTAAILNSINISKYLFELFELTKLKIYVNLLTEPKEYSVRNFDNKIKKKIINDVITKYNILKDITIDDSLVHFLKFLKKSNIKEKSSITNLIESIDKNNNTSYKLFLDDDTVKYLSIIGDVV